MEVYKYGKTLRCGYTTGACAAAAAAAAAAALLQGSFPDMTELPLKGGSVRFRIEDASSGRCWAKCAVRKDAGSDMDVTDGMLIYAEVRKAGAEDGAGRAGDRAEGGAAAPPAAAAVIIRGGEGVGVVTKEGLDQPAGAAAINSGPRRMITEAVMRVCEESDYGGQLTVTVSVPGGLEAARKTFNPVLGIEGGISILGSTGIAEPMSEPALVETIRAEMRVKWLELKEGIIALVPGNYGARFVTEKFEIQENRIIKCSNFIGEALDCACELKIPEIILAGNLGKMIKLAGGIFNTHSRNADCRMDIMMRCAFSAAAPGRGGAASPQEICRVLAELDGCVTTDAAASVLRSAGLLDAAVSEAAERAAAHIKRRCAGAEGGSPRVRLIIISNDMEILGEAIV